MRCLKGHTFPDDDLGAVQLDDGSGILCGFHVDDLLGKMPTPSTDSIGRVITPRNQPKGRKMFSDSLGRFAPTKRAI